MEHFSVENFMMSVKNAVASSCLLTKESQGEAKAETTDFKGSQETKGFGVKLILLLNWRVLAKQISTLIFFPFVDSWLLVGFQQCEAKRKPRERRVNTYFIV